MEWITLTEENKPESGIAVWCKRKNGRIYLATRCRGGLSLNPDASRDCKWYGTQFGKVEEETNNNGIHFNSNFSDVTVDSWAYFSNVNI